MPVRRERSDTRDSFFVSSALTEANYVIGSGVSVVGTVRFDHYTTVGGEVSPRVGIIYAPNLSTKFKYLHSNAYRAPSANEFFQNPDNTNESVRMIDLQSERITSDELTFEQKFSSNIRAILSLYEYRLTDLITEASFEEESFVPPRNEGELRSRGVELYSSAQLSGGIISYCGANYNDSSNEDNGIVVNAPHFSSTCGVSLPFGREKTYLSPEFRYYGERKTLTGADIDPARLVSVTLYSEDVLPTFTTSFSIYDLLNDRPLSPGSSNHRQDKIPHDGRTFRIQITKKF